MRHLPLKPDKKSFHPIERAKKRLRRGQGPVVGVFYSTYLESMCSVDAADQFRDSAASQFGS